MGAKEKTEAPEWGKFKTHSDAWCAADVKWPDNFESLLKVHKSHNYDISTLEDFRWFVLFNIVRSIDRKVNKSKVDTYLQRIQENILDAAHKLIGKTGRITKA